jgi:rhodanese-related sulfurtransferase
MKRTLSMVAVMLLGCAAAVAPARGDAVSIYQATLAEPGQKTAEVSTEEMRHVVAGDDALIIDSRTRAEFDAGHIPGAHVLDVPQSEQVTAVARLVGGDKSKSLVLYCNGPFCGASRRLADQLLARGFTHVRRYQLGIPVWRALGGPVEVEIEGIARVLKLDRTAVFVDGRSTAEFASGSLEGAHSAPVDELASGALKKLPLPEDDFNRRVILFAHDAAAARRMADVLSKRPWHNVSYFPGPADQVIALSGKK